MKKKKLYLLLGSLLAGIILATGILVWRNLQTLNQSKNLSGVEWYDVDAESFTISSAEELYDLAKISEYYNFEGQTIQLDADIVVNEGNAEDWDESAPEKRWYPITGFAGTFDGQGHTISGLYGYGYYSSMGLFADTQKNCKVQNLKLTNSYFSGVGSQGVGSIAGNGAGTFDTIYSDAIIKGDESCYGGIIGVFNIRGNNVVNNCWYDGSMELSGGAAQAAGMVGYVHCLGAANTIKHCLNTATIKGVNTMIGGLCGGVADGSNVDIQDSLNVGTMDCAAQNVGIGSVLGKIGGSDSSTKFTETYTVSESYSNVVGTLAGTVTGAVKRVEAKKLVGYRAYQWTNLDFENYWTVALESTPILQSFAEEVIDVSKVNKIIDTSWYNEDSAVFTIKTVGQLYGFADLLGETNFQGKTIRLGADIVVNEGDAKKWAEEAPEYKWFPLGRSGMNKNYKAFAGTFDGQGYTISGLYTKEPFNSIGLFGQMRGTVKNLKLENSYFEYTGTERYSYVGSIAGQCYGEINTVKSSAIVVNPRRATGGFVGYMGEKTTNTFTNCWFDGTVIATKDAKEESRFFGGILGLLNGGVGKIEHCLNTGTIISQGGNYGGGLVGATQAGGVLTINDSLSAGTLDNQAEVRYIGATFGWLDLGPAKEDGTRDGAIHMTHVYGIEEFSSRLYGAKNPNAAEPYYGVMTKAEDIKGYDGYKYTTLDFAKYWAVNKSGTPILKSFAKSAPKVSGITRMIDLSWYVQGKNEFTIKTTAQLCGFSLLSRIYDFKGQTIHLGADIDVNPGWTAGAEAPEEPWIPIGKSGFNPTAKSFAGTFNGNGHTIRGLYVQSQESKLGFFGEIAGTVGNFILENSYIEYNGVATANNPYSHVGSIAGINYGTIHDIKSSAIVVNSRRATGGLVGYIGGKTTNTITNCWFDGTVITTNDECRFFGGILGLLNGGVAKIEHCLNTGTIVSQAEFAGGLVGAVQTGGVLTINDCLSAGTSDNQAKAQYVGATFGWLDLGKTKDDGTRDGAVHMSNVYGTKEFSSSLYGAKNPKAAAPYGTIVSKDEITGYDGYKWTTLDFNEYWAVNESGTPILKKFASSVPSIAGIDRMIALDWYSEDKKEFTITTVAELFGFATLSETYDFKGQTIRLGANIDVNPGWTAGEVAPEYIWEPIGKSGVNNKAKAFAGTFEGERYAIRGIYVKSDQSNLGFFGTLSGSIGDFDLENSYIEYNGVATPSNPYSNIGSVVGINNGDIHDIKSSAIVVNTRRATGGIAGYMGGTTTNTIRNCWFDGKIIATDDGARFAAGILGIQNGGKGKIEHCLNTGTITVDAQLAAGLVGGVRAKGIITIEDSLNAGICDGAGKFSGAVIGYIEKGPEKDGKTLDSVIMTSVYGIQEFSDKLYGGKDTGACEPEGSVVSKSTIQGYGGYQWTTLDFAKYWSVDENGTPVLTYFTGQGPTVEQYVRPDTRWYDEEDENLYISTREELYGLALLSQTKNFAGQTIYLTANIDLNPGWTAGATKPANVWMPIGSNVSFAGTFDGEGYTVSGLYVSDTSSYLGMFGQADGANIKNFRLKNSYIANTADGSNEAAYVGSIVGRFSGTISSVQSDAIVVNNRLATGGLVGGINDKKAANITNSEFKGELYGTDATGGLVGLVGNASDGTKLTLEHCLNSGYMKITGTFNSAADFESGGLVGSARRKAVLVITDSLNSGDIEIASEINSDIHLKLVGNLVGRVNWNSKATLTNVYGKIQSKDYYKVAYNQTSYQNNVTSTGCDILTDITGEEAYINMGLDFYIPELHKDGHWVILNNESHPVLRKFADTTTYVDVRTISGIRTSWYQDTLYTADDLYGFALKSQTTNFKGRTVKLGADITLNTGDVTVDAIRATWKKWTPVGRWGGNDVATASFAGIFDGQGHTISGLYVSDSKINLGMFGRVDNATIKNFRLTNSYVENTLAAGSSNTYVASVVGFFSGTMSTVQSDAIVKNNRVITGGLIATVQGGATITNSEFKGSLYGADGMGGLVGWVNGSSITITHCMNSGDIHVERKNLDAYESGGLIGTAMATTVTITDSLNAGTIERDSSVPLANVGNLIGRVNWKSTASLTNVYGKTQTENFADVSSTYSTNVTRTNCKLLDDVTGRKTGLSFYDDGQNSSNSGETEETKTKWWIAITNKIPQLEVFHK